MGQLAEGGGQSKFEKLGGRSMNLGARGPNYGVISKTVPE